MVLGCTQPYSAKGYCHGHYQHRRREQAGPIARYRPTLETAPDAATIARFNEVGWTETDAGCWEWSGPRQGPGYGRIRFPMGAAQYPGRTVAAHRMSYEIYVGPIPAGFAILHACDNPPCVNPAHLRTSTQSENIKEMWRRGRSRSQILDMNDKAREAVRKISEDDVRAIRARHAAGGVTQKQLGSEYGITNVQVSRIINRQRWAHVA